MPCYFFQIGHEPIPPRPTTTLFGKPALSLPNIFQYSKEYIANNLFFSWEWLSFFCIFLVAYIRSVDGTIGCFKGLSAKLCANIVSGASFELVKEGIHFESDIRSLTDEDEPDSFAER